MYPGCGTRQVCRLSLYALIPPLSAPPDEFPILVSGTQLLYCNIRSWKCYERLIDASYKLCRIATCLGQESVWSSNWHILPSSQKETVRTTYFSIHNNFCSFYFCHYTNCLDSQSLAYSVILRTERLIFWSWSYPVSYLLRSSTTIGSGAYTIVHDQLCF